MDLPSCAISSAPFHPECDLLQRAMNWTERVPARMNKIIIRRNIRDEEDRDTKWPGVTSDEIELPCYAETGHSGWCGTCLRAAKVSILSCSFKRNIFVCPLLHPFPMNKINCNCSF